MNTLRLAVLVVLAAMATATTPNVKPHYDLKDAENLFAKFIKDYNKHYKDEDDKKVHYEAFKKSLMDINIENKINHLATFDINYLADYTEEEMKEMMGFLPKGKKHKPFNAS